MHTFRSIPPTTGFENYCFGVILANDNIVRVEPIRNVFDPTLLEHHDFNQEHKDMFRCFRDLHSGGSSVRFSLHEQQRAEQRAASWEKILADHGESTDIVFERVYPSLQRMIEGNFCGSNYLQEEEEEQRANQWDLQGDNMSWNFIDMALSWGGLNNRLKKSTVAYGENGGLVGKMIQLFETEGKVSQEGTMPVLPVLHR